MAEQLRGSFKNFVDWWQCAAVMLPSTLPPIQELFKRPRISNVSVLYIPYLTPYLSEQLFKGEEKPSLCLTKHHAMKIYRTIWRWGGQLHVPSALLPAGRAPGTDWIGDWLGPRAGLDAVGNGNKNVSRPCREFTPGRPACSLVTIILELRFSTHKHSMKCGEEMVKPVRGQMQETNTESQVSTATASVE